MNSISFDEAHWPLLIVRFTGLPSEERFDAYLAQRLEYLRRGERHVVVYDTRQARVITSEMRQRHVEWMHQHEALRYQTVLGHALIITSPFFRLTMGVVLGLKRGRTAPYSVWASLPPAALWGADRLAEAGEGAAAERLRHDFAPAACSG